LWYYLLTVIHFFRCEFDKVEETSWDAFYADSLETKFFGQNAIYYPSVPSTMDVARKEARRGADAGTVVVAGEQTEGRGRMKRTWLSPKGNLAFSVILYPEVSYLPFLVIIAALAVVYSIEKATGLRTLIKWPNDILIGGKKVGGILIENEVKRNKVQYAIVGIGINMDVNPEVKENAPVLSTSLKDEIGGSILRMRILKNILREMEKLYLTLPDSRSMLREWRNRLITLGRNVCIYSDGMKLEGVAESVDATGALLLRHADGSLRSIVAGDVTLRDNRKH
jgi:BirA family biotin operon repressor/biotin-[acetyl-CoA-carboxylase] ligase